GGFLAGQGLRILATASGLVKSTGRCSSPFAVAAGFLECGDSSTLLEARKRGDESPHSKKLPRAAEGDFVRAASRRGLPCGGAGGPASGEGRWGGDGVAGMPSLGLIPHPSPPSPSGPAGSGVGPIRQPSASTSSARPSFSPSR